MGDDAATLLAAYDAQLRGAAEVAGSPSWDREGPLWRAVSPTDGFVSYESLEGVDDVDALIADTVAFFEGIPEVATFEWKTRGHDRPPDLGARLEAHGLEPEEIETVMVGEAAALAVEVDLPPGVTVRRVDLLPERDRVVTEAATMQRSVFGAGPSDEEVLDRLDRMAGLEQFWVAEADGCVVSAGRLQLVAGTEFAGLWGGATLAQWRGRGVY
ncbi:MAG: GNAT family N-acetyltransferase, partial [Nocardioides sp.]